MSELISGKDALIALANGKEVEFNQGSHGWVNCLGLNVEQILGSMFQMRLKTQTIKINGVEVPAPFEPKVGDSAWIINEDNPDGYALLDKVDKHLKFTFGAWRTEGEIKKVVEALRSVFK